MWINLALNGSDTGPFGVRFRCHFGVRTQIGVKRELHTFTEVDQDKLGKDADDARPPKAIGARLDIHCEHKARLVLGAGTHQLRVVA